MLPDIKSLPILSCIPSITWPPVVSPMGAQLYAMLAYLENSQWFPLEEMLSLQMSQVLELINYSRVQSSYYRERLSHLPKLTSVSQLLEEWRNIPILTRADLQEQGDNLFCQTSPPGHEPSQVTRSSGSTGRPVATKLSQATQFFWNAFALRDHTWHKLDFTKHTASIRFTPSGKAEPPHGQVADHWSSATFSLLQSGKNYHLNLCTVEEEAEWLRRVNPYYLVCNPSTLRELTNYFAKYGGIPSNLKHTHTNSEIVEPDLPKMVKEVLGAKLVDTYSSNEIGFIALQCPEFHSYHIQSENVFVEILNDQNEPCVVGEPGHVVVTALHNFSSPLIRYQLGDYAIWDEPCACGRNLPVLKQILGRKRNIILMPDGRRLWPSFKSQGVLLSELFSKAQFQVVQKSLTDIHINLVGLSPFSEERELELQQLLARTFEHPFKFTFNHLDEIKRGPNGKYEDFISEIA